MELKFPFGLRHDNRLPPIRIPSTYMREMVDSEQESDVAPKDDKRKQNKKQNEAASKFWFCGGPLYLLKRRF